MLVGVPPLTCTSGGTSNDGSARHKIIRRQLVRHHCARETSLCG
jgi:hypothetical protein